MRKLKIVFLFIIVSNLPMASQVLWQMNKDTVITYYYTDGDEFSGENDLKEKWKSWFGWARSILTNKEQQYYSEYENHEIKDGAINLTVKKQHVNARLVDWMGDKDSVFAGNRYAGDNKRNYKYTAGLITLKKEFLKGYFEIKFKAPSEKGLWPAFWLYGGSPNEEIDIMELKGERKSQIHVDTHCGNCDMVRNPIGLKRSFGGWIDVKGKLNEGFNVVAGLWDDNEVRYYVNGKCMAISKVKFTKPKNLVANVAVPDNNGPFHPGPDTNIVNFSPYVIDYIRVWTKDEKQEVKKVLADEKENKYPISDTKLSHSPKMLYAKKSDHKNDGIFISSFKNNANFIEIYCNGLNKGESYHVKLAGPEANVLFEGDVKAAEFKIPVAVTSYCNLEVSYKNKKVARNLLPNFTH